MYRYVDKEFRDLFFRFDIYVFFYYFFVVQNGKKDYSTWYRAHYTDRLSPGGFSP